jgi:type II secretory pathway pseudopilin PulG
MEVILYVALAVILLIAVLLAIIIYNQMLLLNEVNKRLLLLAAESIEKERITMAELNKAIQDQYSLTPVPGQEGEMPQPEKPFDPHQVEAELPD